MKEHDALRLALAMYRQPLFKSTYLSKPIPKGVLLPIKIAAGSEEVCQLASDELQIAPQTLRAASVFYLQQVLAQPQLDAYGCLCLAPGAAPADIASHKRWLLKWLHPDRNSNRWEAALFQRVLGAAEKIENKGETNTTKDALSKSNAGPQVVRHRSRAKRTLNRPAPVFNWRTLAKRATKRLVVFGPILLLVGGAIFQFSNLVIGTGTGQLTALFGW